MMMHIDAVDKTLHKRQLMEKLAESHFRLEIPEHFITIPGQLIHQKNDHLKPGINICSQRI